MNNKYILENNYDISHTIETSSQSSTVRVTDEKFTPMQITFRKAWRSQSSLFVPELPVLFHPF